MKSTKRKIQRASMLFTRFRALDLPMVPSMLSFLRYHFKEGHTLENFFNYRLYDPEIDEKEKRAFLPRAHAEHIWATFNPPWYSPALTNKYIFNSIAENAGLSVPKLYGVFDPETGSDNHGGHLKTVDDLSRVIRQEALEEFVLKPVEGMQAKFVYALRQIDAHETYEELRRGRMTLCDVVAAITNQKELRAQLFRPNASVNYTSFLLQERLRQHPDMLKIAGPRLSPIRVVTLSGVGGSTEVIAAKLHLLDHRSAKDATDSGAIESPIDVESGVIGMGVKTKSVLESGLTQSPVALEPFAGEKCPLWDEAKDLVLRAARSFPFCRAIGWDVALTPQGAVLLEGNARWGFTSLQASMSKGLYRGEFKRTYQTLVRASGTRTKTLSLE